jgi:hypothetical protein
MSTAKVKSANVELVNNCSEYARSLVNNISLLSGHVLAPTDLDLSNICSALEMLQESGFNLKSEYNTKLLIHGTDAILERMPAYQRLKNTLLDIEKITMKTDTSQYGGAARARYPVLSSHAGLYNPETGRIY